jgi:ribosomal protein S18 acetylase RimI-like enzyme
MDILHTRLLSLADLDQFRQLRLRGAQEEPAAFLEDYDELCAAPEEHFTRYFANGWIAGAFLGDRLAGACGLYRCKGKKLAHKGVVWGVYMAPEARGQGGARRLIEILLAEAQAASIELVQLSTDMSNKVTVALYQSLGFREYGVEKHMLKLADRYVDDVWMVKFLKESA